MPRYSPILNALNERLQSHLPVGKLLAGYKYEPTPLKDPEGEKDFPVIRMFLPDINETFHAVAIVDGMMTMRLTLSVSKKLGLVNLIVESEKLMDAIEITDQGALDLSLGGLLAKPPATTLRDCFATELSLTAHIFVSVLPKPVARGKRRL